MNTLKAIEVNIESSCRLNKLGQYRISVLHGIQDTTFVSYTAGYQTSKIASSRQLRIWIILLALGACHIILIMRVIVIWLEFS